MKMWFKFWANHGEGRSEYSETIVALDHHPDLHEWHAWAREKGLKGPEGRIEQMPLQPDSNDRP